MHSASLAYSQLDKALCVTVQCTKGRFYCNKLLIEFTFYEVNTDKHCNTQINIPALFESLLNLCLSNQISGLERTVLLNYILVTWYYTLQICECAVTKFSSTFSISIIFSWIKLDFLLLLWLPGCHISHSSTLLPLQALRPPYMTLIFHKVTFMKTS